MSDCGAVGDLDRSRALLRGGLVGLAAIVVCTGSLLFSTSSQAAGVSPIVGLGADVTPTDLNASDQVSVGVVRENGGRSEYTSGLWSEGTITIPDSPPPPSGDSSDEQLAAQSVNDSGVVTGEVQLTTEEEGVTEYPFYDQAGYWNSASSTTFSCLCNKFESNGIETYRFSDGAIDTAGEIVGSGFVYSGSGGESVGWFIPGSSGVPTGSGEPQSVTSLGGVPIVGLADINANYEVGFFKEVAEGGGESGNEVVVTAGPLVLYNRKTGEATKTNVYYQLGGAFHGLSGDGALVGRGPKGPVLRLASGSEASLTIPAGGSAYVDGINDSHISVGFARTAGGGDYAAMWEADGSLKNLNSLLPVGSGWQLESAVAINDSGDIVGVGTHDGTREGFLLKTGLTVTSAADEPATKAAKASDKCESENGVCTLRAAIETVDAARSTASTTIRFSIQGVESGKLATIVLKEALPAIEYPVELDAATQPDALEVEDTYSGIPRKIGAIVEAKALPAESDGIKLAAGAKGSVVEGLQVQHVSGDGVLLEAEGSQLADSVLYEDTIGVEVAANGVTVGNGAGHEGDIFFRDGHLNELASYLKGLKGHKAGLAAVDEQARSLGAGVLLGKQSSGTSIMGDWIGIHGAGFESGADPLPADGIKTVRLESEPVTPVGVAVLPSAAGGVKNVTIGGSEHGQRDVISATLIGILAGAASGTSIEGLTISEATVGPDVTGSASTGAIGTVVGVLASGNIGGLKVSGGNYSGDLIGVFLGEGLSSPVVEGAGFGSGSELPEEFSKGIALADGFGLMLGNTEGAQVGGASAAQGNRFRGDLVGIGLLGESVRRDSFEHNVIGAEVKTFTTFLKEDYEFVNFAGVLAIGNGCKGKQAAQSQEIALGSNRLEGDVAGLFSICTTGFALAENTFENSALGVLDLGSGGMHVGTPGHGNAFVQDGLGAVQANFEPTAADYKQAQVNPEDASAKTREKYLSAPDEELAYDGVDAVTALDFSSTSTEPPAAEGTHNTYYGNRFGVSASGEPQPDELPALIIGDEHELRFGGVNPGEGNTVEDNRDGGVWITNAGAEHDPTVQLLGNTIYNNENFTGSIKGLPGLGIDLIGEAPGFGPGVNEQDPKQPDTSGPNYFQNSPVLSSANVASGTLTVEGTLHGAANTEYLVEVFADENPNPFGAGEGQTLLGRLSLTTNAAGSVGFSAGFAEPGAAYRVVSSTATTVPGPGLAGVTSEFSIDQPITRTPTPPSMTPPSTGSTTTTPATSPSTTATTTTTGTGGTGNTGQGAVTTTVGASGSSAVTATGSVTLPASASCSSATTTPCTVKTTATVPAGSAGAASFAATVVAAKHEKSRVPVTIGAGSMTLEPGATGRLHLTLSKRGLALLRARRSLAIAVTVRITGRGRPTIVRTLHFELKYKPKAQKKTNRNQRTKPARELVRRPSSKQSRTPALANGALGGGSVSETRLDPPLPFAHESPVRVVSDRIEQFAPRWDAMHGATIAGDSFGYYTKALREQEFAYRGLLLGRER